MQRSLLLCLFLTVSCASHDAGNARNFASTHIDYSTEIQNTIDYLKVRQKEDRSFRGVFVSDASQEAILLGIARKLEHSSPEFEQEMIAGIFSRMEKDKKGWYTHPGSGADFNVTGYVLKVLESFGISRSDERVATAWDFFEREGGVNKLNLSTKLQLGLLGVIPADKAFPPLPIKILNLPNVLFMEKLGIYGEMFIPLLGWLELKKLPDQALKAFRPLLHSC